MVELLLNMAIDSDFFRLKMVIFHNYVQLPEGMFDNMISVLSHTVLHAAQRRAAEFRLKRLGMNSWCRRPPSLSQNLCGQNIE